MQRFWTGAQWTGPRRGGEPVEAMPGGAEGREVVPQSRICRLRAGISYCLLVSGWDCFFFSGFVVLFLAPNAREETR